VASRFPSSLQEASATRPSRYPTSCRSPRSPSPAITSRISKLRNFRHRTLWLRPLWIASTPNHTRQREQASLLHLSHSISLTPPYQSHARTLAMLPTRFERFGHLGHFITLAPLSFHSISNSSPVHSGTITFSMCIFTRGTYPT